MRILPASIRRSFDLENTSQMTSWQYKHAHNITHRVCEAELVSIFSPFVEN